MAEGEGKDSSSSSFDISNVTASAGELGGRFELGWGPDPTGLAARLVGGRRSPAALLAAAYSPCHACAPLFLAGKLWDDKLGEAGKAFDEQLSSVVGTASSALDSGLAAASEAVRAGVSSAARETNDIKSRLQQFYDTGVAHYQAAEQQALDGLKQGVRYVRYDHPEASLAGGVALAAVLLPGPRRFLLRQTIGRFRSEEAMYRSAELRYGALKERVEGQTGDLQKLQASTMGGPGDVPSGGDACLPGWGACQGRKGRGCTAQAVLAVGWLQV